MLWKYICLQRPDSEETLQRTTKKTQEQNLNDAQTQTTTFKSCCRAHTAGPAGLLQTPIWRAERGGFRPRPTSQTTSQPNSQLNIPAASTKTSQCLFLAPKRPYSCWVTRERELHEETGGRGEGAQKNKSEVIINFEQNHDLSIEEPVHFHMRILFNFEQTDNTLAVLGYTTKIRQKRSKGAIQSLYAMSCGLLRTNV